MSIYGSGRPIKYNLTISEGKNHHPILINQEVEKVESQIVKCSIKGKD